MPILPVEIPAKQSAAVDAPSTMSRVLKLLIVIGFILLATRTAGADDLLKITSLQPLPVETHRGATAKLEFSVENVSGQPIEILSIFPRRGKGSGKAEPKRLPVGGTGRIILDYTFPESLGKNLVNFLVKTDAPGAVKAVPIPVPYFVQSPYEPEYPVIDFGDVHPGMRVQSVIEVTNHDAPTLVAERVVSKPDWLDLVLSSAESGSAQTLRIVATTNKLPLFGLSSSEIVLATNVAAEPLLKIPVAMRVFSKYSGSPIPLSLGGVTDGDDKHATVRINRIDGGDVKLAAIESGHRSLAIESSECGKGCLDLLVTFDSMQSRKGLRSTVKVSFSDDEVPLIIPVDALVVPVGVEISDLGSIDEITVKGKNRILEGQP